MASEQRIIRTSYRKKTCVWHCGCVCLCRYAIQLDKKNVWILVPYWNGWRAEEDSCPRIAKACAAFRHSSLVTYEIFAPFIYIYLAAAKLLEWKIIKSLVALKCALFDSSWFHVFWLVLHIHIPTLNYLQICANIYVNESKICTWCAFHFKIPMRFIYSCRSSKKLYKYTCIRILLKKDIEIICYQKDIEIRCNDFFVGNARSQLCKTMYNKYFSGLKRKILRLNSN